MSNEGEQPTWYEQMGGRDFFGPLVDGFYARVATDPLLRPMYPEGDLGPARDRLLWFLEQYWGGPKTYGEQRGHPRLRMRHVPYAVTPKARDRWLQLMGESLAEQDVSDSAKTMLWEYMTHAAQFLVNATDEDHPEQRKL